MSVGYLLSHAVSSYLLSPGRSHDDDRFSCDLWGSCAMMFIANLLLARP